MSVPTLDPTGIRTDLVARLRGQTPAGTRVFDSRRVNYDTDEFPAIAVFTPGGNDDKWALGGSVVKHSEKIVIVGDLKGSSETTIAAELDATEAAIMDCLAGDDEWLSAFETVESVDTTKAIDAATGHMEGHLVMMIDVKYSVCYERNTITPAAPLETVAVTVNLRPADPTHVDISKRALLGTLPEDE